MNITGRHGGAEGIALSKEEAKLQKKGIPNMSLEELNVWLSVCSRNELNSKFNKGRRGWKEEKEKVEARIEQLST
jgi:hypothetical protein